MHVLQLQQVALPAWQGYGYHTTADYVSEEEDGLASSPIPISQGNPSSTTSLEALQDLRDIGINRYSLGIQSFQNHILKDLGRDHTPATALRSLIDAKSVWPGRVSMDLIMGHTGQTLADWRSELKFAMDIVDDHLSLYHLTVEPGTDLYKDVRSGLVSTPNDDLATDMYEAIIEITEAAGFEHYEVSNFARNKAYSQHNSGHWQGVDYLGIGPGAHGRVTDPATGDRVRTFNIRDPTTWMAHCKQHGSGLRRTVVMSDEETKQELVVLGMRTKAGVNFARFKQLTKQDLMQYLDADAVMICTEAGLILKTQDALSPTERGMAVADELVTRLLP
ncbi:radical S-adenosyl methionine domain-containing protein 1 [Haplosporangium bisporale]|nr:radical S-adenosyl methionine domain-containing protein 1 [Haplosporangium bisporale]